MANCHIFDFYLTVYECPKEIPLGATLHGLVSQFGFVDG
jgi:hypothetical protein